MTHSDTATRAWWSGARDVGPMIVGYLPFALIIGATVTAAGPLLPRLLSTPLLLGGSAQLVTLQLLDSGSPVPLVVMAGLVTNARLLAFSASLAPHWRQQPRWFRLVGAALLIDPTWVLAQRDLDDGGGRRHRSYYLGAALTLGFGWVAMVTVGGLALGAASQTGSVGDLLSMAAPLSLAALIAPQLDRRAMIAAATTAALVGFATASWPAGSGLLTAIVAATAVGWATDVTDATDVADASDATDAAGASDQRDADRGGRP